MTSKSLEAEVSRARREISADSISMSITELTNLYIEGVLLIRPEFQRLFRWDNGQKSRLIESVLLGIPLPSIFVAQSEGGKWELVDGLQRVSTLLELQGLLKKNDGRTRPPTVLGKTDFLPSLAGMSWLSEDPERQLSEAQKLDVRLARLDLRVIKRSSTPAAKFDLFQRLNSFGSPLTAQELRSALVAAVSSDCLAWLTRLSEDEDFRTCLSLSDRLLDEQYDIELVLRFLMLHNREMLGRGAALADFPLRLNDWALELAASSSRRWGDLDGVFRATFASLAQRGGEDIFRKWDSGKRAFRGGFSNTAFEVIALGVGYHKANGRQHRLDYLDAARSLWEMPTMSARFTTGLATQDRLATTIPLGRRLMADPQEDS